jgi:OOP family OmpA-OmpF porin
MAEILRRTMMAGVVAAALWSPVAHAQAVDQTGATSEELQLLFQRQKSRGLKLAPNTAVAPTVAPETEVAATGTDLPTEADVTATASAEPEVPVAEPTGTAVTVAEGTTPTEVASGEAQPVQVAYTELDKADQINFRIGFDFDSSVLRDGEKPKLASLCAAMKAVDVAVFRIVGHTDAAGTEEYNEKLSLLRAEEVKRHLVSDCGIEPARLQAVGVGKRYLYNTDDPRSEDNRRVEFQALS